MMFKKPVSLATLVLSCSVLLTSCAGLQSRDPSQQELVELSPEQLEQINREALDLASQRLTEMVASAKSSPDMTRYLSTDLFLKANMAMMSGDHVTAAMLFTHVNELVPADSFVAKKLAVNLIRLGELEKAEKVLAKVYSDSNKTDEKVGLILAGIYGGLGDEKKAVSTYEEILAKNPKSEDACVFLSKAYAIDKQELKAIKKLEKCGVSDKTNGVYHFYIGKIYQDMKQEKKAEAAYRHALKVQPKFSQAVSSLGSLYEEKEQIKAAVSLYTDYIAKNKKDSVILERLVQLLFVQERYTEVIPFAERLSDLQPDNLNLKVKLGILYTDAKKYSEAVNVFKELLSFAPESDKILYYLGAIYQEMRQYQDSIEYFNQIPSNSGLYSDSSLQMANMLSNLAQEEKKYGENFVSFVNERILVLPTIKVELSVIKAGYYEAVGENKLAMEAMMVVQDEKSFSTQHKYYLANLYERLQKYDESSQLIKGIIEKEPKNAQAWNFLGYAMLERGDNMDEAFSYITKAVELSPEDGYIRDSLGWYYFKKGEYSRALKELDFAFKKVPDDVEISKHLAIIHRQMKNFSKARDYFENALRHARIKSERVDIISQIEKLESERLPASAAQTVID
ncbi:MAG: tetratricopeptide repeat protein [Bacteriovoracaceae bacterium]